MVNAIASCATTLFLCKRSVCGAFRAWYRMWWRWQNFPGLVAPL